MSTKILGNEELNILRAKTPYSLPDNPSDKGFNARQIKTKFWEGYLLLFNWLKETQASLNNDFATTNSALLNESKRIDVILTYFSDGKANFAVKDRNNNIIDETYELKSEASTKFNQLIADIQSVSSASGNKISGTQNINADGIQYTITLSNTQNATLSTITQYLPLATTLKAGLLSSTDKEKINNIESDLTNFLANAKAYTDEKLQRDNIVNILGAASHTLIGLLTAEDKKKIDALYSLLGEQEDADTVVNTINEVLAIFSSYPEGVDIVSQLEKKVNYTDVINTLDSEEISKPLSAKMGKELKTKVDTKAELAYVNEELDKKALKSDILVIDEAVTAQESEIATTQNEADKLVDEIVGYVDGSPRGVYASLSALQSAFPSGTQGVYVCSDNGHWYYWNGSAWTDGGVYQATEIADASITPDKTSFMKPVSLLNPDMCTLDKRPGWFGTTLLDDSAFVDGTNYLISNLIVVEPNTTYIFNGAHYLQNVYEADESGITRHIREIDNNTSFVTYSDTKYMRIVFTYNGTQYNNNKWKTILKIIKGNSLEDTLLYGQNAVKNFVIDGGSDVIKVPKGTSYSEGEGIIVLTFDGWNQDTFDKITPYLKEKNIPFTQFMSLRSIDSPYPINKNDIRLLKRDFGNNYEIGWYTGQPAAPVYEGESNYDDQFIQMKDSIDSLINNGIEFSNVCAYAGGRNTELTRYLCQKIFKMKVARDTSGGTINSQEITTNFNMKCRSFGNTDVDLIKSVISSARQNGAHVCLLTHSILNENYGITNETYSTTEANLKSIIDHLVSNVSLGLKVMTVSQYYYYTILPHNANVGQHALVWENDDIQHEYVYTEKGWKEL